MQTESELYSAAILPAITDLRETRVRVTVKSVTDPVTAAVSDSHGADAISRDAQVVDGIYNTRYRFASAEPNCWALDGTTVLQPDVGQEVEIGFMSSAIAGAAGVFADPPYVEVAIDPVIDVTGLSIMFDLLDNQYAVDFDLYLEYGAAQTATLNVTGNASAIYNLAAVYAELALVRVTINTWSNVGRKARVTEIGFGLIQQFGPELDEPILTASAVAESDITTETLPYGELVFEFYDTNDEFSPLTPTARTKVFTEGTTISSELGVRVPDGSIEYALTGTFRFADWIIVASKVVRVRAVDMIGFAGPRNPLEQYGGRTKTNAYNAVMSFFSDARAANLDYPTNVYFDTSTFPNTGTDFLDGPYASTVFGQLIRLAQWSMTIPHVDVNGVVRFKQLTSTPLKVVDFDNLFVGQRMTRYNQVLGVRVYYYDVAVSSDISEIALATANFGVGTVLVFDIGYNYEVYDVVPSGGASVVSTAGFAYGKYTLTASGNGTITVRGKVWVVGRQFVEAPNTSVTDPKALWVEVDNPHICTQSRAADVADWLLALYARITEVNFDWRGTPEIETLDVIDLEPQDGTQVDSFVLRHEWIHDGALQYTTKGAAMWLHP